MIELLESRIAPATFTVTNLSDLPVGGETSLREAVDLANLDPATADTITFDPTLFPPGATAKIVLLSTIPITGPVTIKAPGIDKLTVDGSGTTRAFFIDDLNAAVSSSVSISNLGIIGGSGGTNGGAIVCFEPLSLTNVAITGGQVNSAGGGLWVGTAGKVTLSGCRIFGNTADYGGGVNIEAAAGITITKTIFAGNSAVDFDGGGALLKSTGPAGFIKIISSQVVNNTANLQGGGLWLQVDETRPVTIAKCVIQGNSGDEGGGVQLNNGRADVSGSFFTGNSAVDGGGGMHAGFDNELVLTTTIFSGNSAIGGGGIDPTGGAIFIGGAAGIAKISGSQFLHNTSADDGGALALNSAGVTISSSLFSGNTAAADGGAIFQTYGSLVLKGDSFIANSAVSGGAILADGDVTVSGGKFVQNIAGANGGAIFSKRSGPLSAGSLAVTGTLFQGNGGDGGAGALIFFDDSTATIKGAKFLDNFAHSTGGAIQSATTGTVEFSGCLFRGNAADSSGGAVRITLGDATITSCSFFENTGSMQIGDGGAISIKNTAGNVTLSKLKVIGNVAGTGGGISNFGAATTLTASTVTGNFAATDPNTSGI